MWETLAVTTQSGREELTMHINLSWADAARLVRMWKLPRPAVGGSVLLPTGAKLYRFSKEEAKAYKVRTRYSVMGYAFDGADVKATIMMLL
jgi:hypothetical protein